MQVMLHNINEYLSILIKNPVFYIFVFSLHPNVYIEVLFVCNNNEQQSKKSFVQL